MALNYLLDPAFEMVNTAGKPATGGKVNVFVHGTRDKYYCASDFNGTLLPFDIPLDSLGSAVILADDSQAYDIYIYNRYGSLMMSRYNVQPKSGGGVSVQSITSTDGTITVTDTAGGVDLSVNGATPSVLCASGDILTSDGSFTCTPLKQSGSEVIVDQNGKVKVEHGWYHYDIVTHFDYSGTPTNQTVVVALKHGGLESRKEVDLSYPNEGTIALSAETFNPASGLEEFDISVSGIPVGMSIELVELGIHSIVGHGAGGGVDYTAGNGITIQNDEISVDTSVVATKTDLESKQDTLTAGDNISIVDNVISATAAPQVNADWDATSGVAEILNKPDLSIYAEKSELATVATTGSYDNLLDKPTIPPAQVNSDWDATSGVSEILNKPDLSIYAESSDLATVAKTGSYDDLLDKPSIPPAQVNADWTSSSGVSEILHKPTEKDLVAGSNITITESNGTVTISAAASEQVNSDWDATSGVAEILHKPDLSIYAESGDLATVAKTGSYDDLLDKPTIPPAQVNSDWNATSGVAEILNKPTIPSYTAGNGIDITSSVISADTSVLATKSELPTATSDLTNDSGFITSSDVPVKDVQVGGTSVVNAQGIAEISIPPTGVLDVEVDGSSVVNAQGVAEIVLPTFTQVNADWDATSGVSEILNKPSIPTATSDLTNDSGFITLSDVPAQVNADWNSSSGASEILNKPTIPTVDQNYNASSTNAQSGAAVAQAIAAIPSSSYTAGNGIDITGNVVSAKVDGTTITTNVGGELTVIGGGGGGSQVNSDWDATSGVAEILNKPTPKTLTAGQGISIADGVSTVTISSNVTVPVQDVTVDGTSVVSNGVAAITSPTVDQTYDATSANSQSGVAVAEAISAAVIPISIVSELPANPDPNTLYVVTGA